MKVADFGLARAVEADAAATRTGLMMGTVAYCAPEQISRGSADPRSDVYAAGVVLFELLTGAPPYTGDSAMNVAYQHVHIRVPAPSSRGRGIPPPRSTSWSSPPPTATRPAGRRTPARSWPSCTTSGSDLGLPVVAVPAPRAPRRPARVSPPPIRRPVGVRRSPARWPRRHAAGAGGRTTVPPRAAPRNAPPRPPDGPQFRRGAAHRDPAAVADPPPATGPRGGTLTGGSRRAGGAPCW